MNVKSKFKTRKIKTKDDINSYTEFLKIKSQHSFFNELHQLIYVKFPVNDSIFEVQNIFNLSSKNKNRIVIHISNKKNSQHLNKPSDNDYMVSGFFAITDIINVVNTSLILDENSNLTVIVFNENTLITIDNINNFIKDSDFETIENQLPNFLPNEKGGGVIIEGP